jgi:hypothetical protein
LPSRVLGNGIQVNPVTALVLRDRLDGVADRHALVERVERAVHERQWSPRAIAAAPTAAFDAAGAVASALDTTLPSLQRLGLVTHRPIA